MFIDFTEVEPLQETEVKVRFIFEKKNLFLKAVRMMDDGRGGHIILSPIQDLTYFRILDIKRDIGLKMEVVVEDQENCKSGKDIKIKVPVGTLIREKNIKYMLQILTENNFSFILCKGGKGGARNIHFKTSTNQHQENFNGCKRRDGLFEIE